MKAVILAAGTGSRLVHLTRDLPKALVPVGKQPLIDHAIGFVRTAGCSDITVVGGFYFSKLKQHLEEVGADVQLVENKNFLKGNIFTLLRAFPKLDDSFLLVNVDHVFPLRLAVRLANEFAGIDRVTAVVDFDRPLQQDDMKVSLTPDLQIAKISKGLHDFDAGYVGMTFVPRGAIAIYKDTVEKVARENQEAVVEHVLQRLVADGHSPGIVDISGTRWLEIDNQNDLQNAERILKWNQDFLG